MKSVENGEGWGKDRGPDLLAEFDLFALNIARFFLYRGERGERGRKEGKRNEVGKEIDL